MKAADQKDQVRLKYVELPAPCALPEGGRGAGVVTGRAAVMKPL